VHETRRGSSAHAVPGRPNERPVDDWLGEISDDDWSENPAERGARAPSAYQELAVPAGKLPQESGAARPPPVAAAEARRAVVVRRRLAAGLVLAVVLGLAVVIPVLALRGGDRATVTPLPEPASTTPASTETSPSEVPSTTPTNPTTQPPATGDAPAFVLPEGVKLQREGEGDPALIRELQQALVSAGFDPGPADGTFGRRTEAAVVGFQQANGLSVDGRVGPETAEALNRALASG
jgi:hypothetical protein